MTDEKICPIMSRPICDVSGGWLDPELKCKREECMAWVPECPMDEKNRKDCEPGDCEVRERGYLECKGGCRLI